MTVPVTAPVEAFGALRATVEITGAELPATAAGGTAGSSVDVTAAGATTAWL